MSTRCNVIVKNAESRIVLYRHCDGYPAEAGATLVEAIRSAPKYDEFPSIVGGLLALRYEQQSYEKAPRPVYQITDGVHGDIEWCYEVNTDELGAKGVRVVGRPAGNPDVDAWVEGGSWIDLPALVEVVNRNRLEINQRLAAMKKRQPGAYSDTEPYPMMEASA